MPTLNVFWGNVPWQHTTEAAKNRTSFTAPGKISNPFNDGTASSWSGWRSYDCFAKPVFDTVATPTSGISSFPRSDVAVLEREVVKGFGVKLDFTHGVNTFGKSRRNTDITVLSENTISVTGSGDQRPGGSSDSAWTIKEVLQDKPKIESLAGFTSALATTPSTP